MYSLTDTYVYFILALTALAGMRNAAFGEVSLKAKQLIDVYATAPFQDRLDALKASLVSSSADLASLALQPNLAVSVDMLTVLFSDPDAKVRKSAVETYLRRVYRASTVKSLDISEINGLMTAKW